jgi:hypothetical protein
MLREAVNLIAFFVPFLGMIALGCLVSGCASPSTWANSPSGNYNVMPVALGDANFHRWLGSGVPQ